MDLGLAITLGIWFVGFVFFLLYWLGEFNAVDDPIPKTLILFFALLWPGILVINIIRQIGIGIGKGCGKLTAVITRIGTKLYNKIN